MRATRVADTARFAALAAALVAADPVGCTVLATSVARGLRDPALVADVLWWVAADDGGTVRAAGQHWPPYRLGVQGVPAESAEALAPALVDLVLAEGRRPAGVTGTEPVADAVGRVWAERTGAAVRVSRRMRRHVLGTLAWPRGVPGAPRPAAAEDAELLARWIAGFRADVGEHGEEGQDFAARVLAEGGGRLWQDGGRPVSLAVFRPAAAGVSRVGPVYTPPGLRGRGYGSAVTAAASRDALDAGAEGVCLYTDLANPVSNAIYARLGYAPAGDELELTFEPLSD